MRKEDDYYNSLTGYGGAANDERVPLYGHTTPGPGPLSYTTTGMGGSGFSRMKQDPLSVTARFGNREKRLLDVSRYSQSFSTNASSQIFGGPKPTPGGFN